MKRISRTLFAVALLCITPLAFAQVQSGNVFGSVVDAQNQPVPGATVTLSGVGAPQVFVTDRDGRFRFLNVAPESYTLSAELPGFATVTRPVEVNLARNSEVELSLSPAVEQNITVTADTPLIDVRR